MDCRDSFTHNLAQAIGEIVGPMVRLDVVRHDLIDLDAVAGYDRIILSPGPGLPGEMENLATLIRRYASWKPILGVCLGHQAIAQAFGARLLNLERVCHGLKSKVRIVARSYLFDGLPAEIDAGRYHSWLVDGNGLPGDLLVTAVDEKGDVMGLSHRSLDVHGVQFHPESILTPAGPRILRNFLQ
ncbi:MAG: aminodeoxychorismate/anthranilate synthase component II [Deltaproteobacteria bacterium]|nr:aminodeoxychorismate/anthranilate synthase component II [Deltaproteobacteria bacterium]